MEGDRENTEIKVPESFDMSSIQDSTAINQINMKVYNEMILCLNKKFIWIFILNIGTVDENVRRNFTSINQ